MSNPVEERRERALSLLASADRLVETARDLITIQGRVVINGSPIYWHGAASYLREATDELFNALAELYARPTLTERSDDGHKERPTARTDESHQH